ncbi:MAG: hypothetical protein A2017_08225 [Lentisphaerae bacterium GWF2_44_16]|nr:MAG: hypothetical protein A2017_08225 [Lentisphaerae bacterium GWF2_44_16]
MFLKSKNYALIVKHSLCCFIFTMIELLIVIAIIFILASLLFPGLKKARDTALAISCTSKLKQIGTIVSYYENDYNGYIPPCMWSPDADAYVWPMILYPYNNSLFSKDGKGQKAWTPSCPGDKKTDEGKLLGDHTYIDYSKYNFGGYGMNDKFGCYGSQEWSPRIKSGQLGNPSLTLMFCDSYYYQITKSFWDDVNSFTAFRHNNGLNIMFADYHVSSKKKGPASIVRWDK